MFVKAALTDKRELKAR
jgi:hypothetical protein